MLLDFRNPPYFIIDKVISFTGRYMGFYGTHYHAGHFCRVVGASDKTDGVVLARHYNTQISLNEELAKHAAEKLWEELKAGLIRPPAEGEDESSDASTQLSHLFDTYDTEVRKRRHSV